MKRLFTKVYLALLFVLVVFFLLTALLFWRGPQRNAEQDVLAAAARVAQLALPESGDRETQQAAVDAVAEALDASVALHAPGGERVASRGRLLPGPRLEADASHWIRGRHRGPTAALKLDDGYWLVAAIPGRPPHPHGFLVLLAILLLALAAGAFPLARGITSRVERLTDRVDALGRGEFGARVEVSGNDEIARLAESFNRAGERIEGLVGSQRTLLASASHELRSPLARLRVAVELLAGDREETRELRERIERDVGLLDAGVEELLVVSRLDLRGADAYTELDLLALVAEEAARFGVEVEGDVGEGAIRIHGEERSLRHLIRNLLANAEKHAGRPGLGVRVRTIEEGEVAQLRVLDRGPGVPAADREEIFQPFRRGSVREGDAGPAPSGVGLGLAIVREIARRHRGSVVVLDREGGGSEFRVSLPTAGASGGSRPASG